MELKHDHMRPLLAAVALLIGLLLGFCSPVSFGAEEELYLYAELASERAWVILADEALQSLADGQLVALLMTLRVADGMSLSRVLPAEGLVATVSQKQGGLVTVLLDGKLPRGDSPLVRIEWEDGRLGSCTDVCVTELCLYLLREDGEVESVPVSVVTAHAEDDLLSETASEAATLSEETEPLPQLRPAVTEAEGECATGSDPEVELSPARYIGCRESRVTGGGFAVQLLFEAAGMSPAVSLMGGGSVTLTSEAVCIGGRTLYALTYRGLPADRVCRFSVYTADGTVEIIYRNGRFISQRLIQL